MGECWWRWIIRVSFGVKRLTTITFCGICLEQGITSKTRSERDWSGERTKARGSSHHSCSWRRCISPALEADSFLQHVICSGKRTNTKKRSDIHHWVFNLSPRVPMFCMSGSTETDQVNPDSSLHTWVHPATPCLDTDTARACYFLSYPMDDQRAPCPSLLTTISVEGQQQSLRSADHWTLLLIADMSLSQGISHTKLTHFISCWLESSLTWGGPLCISQYNTLQMETGTLWGALIYNVLTISGSPRWRICVHEIQCRGIEYFFMF